MNNSELESWCKRAYTAQKGSYRKLFSGLLRVDAEKRVDTRRDSVHEYVVFLRQLRNSHLPVHRIPPEILVEIFLRVQEEAIYPRKSLTHVCHQWRALALSISALWCDISLSDRDVSKALLERCKFGPIHIQFCTRRAMPLQEIEEWREILDPHASRMRTIRLYGKNKTSLRSSLRCFCGPCSSLEYLSMSSCAIAPIPWIKPINSEGITTPYFYLFSIFPLCFIFVAGHIMYLSYPIGQNSCHLHP